MSSPAWPLESLFWLLAWECPSCARTPVGQAAARTSAIVEYRTLVANRSNFMESLLIKIADSNFQLSRLLPRQVITIGFARMRTALRLISASGAICG
jgi:hypothetical protein